jgi:N6-L-threonylcarbamoyladenine synthase
VKVLGIETSCDETAVAVVDGETVLANLIASQVDVHERFGGVVPELASRAHVEALTPLIDAALESAGCGFRDLDGVAVTVGPGLVGALLVGMAAAKSIAFATGAPLIGVNHLEGHILANAVDHGPELTPAVCLVVSGGHTMLVHMPEPHRYELLGQTVDDAAGEAFDRLARDGDPNAIRFPRAMADSGDFDFSLSGLKTAVLRHVKAERQAGRDVDPADLAASFQEAIVDVQVAKTIDAARDRRVETVLLGGGVVANTRLRERMEKAAGAEAGFRVLFPPLDLCTDNGAMIAVAGTWRLLRGERASLGVGADPSLELG